MRPQDNKEFYIFYNTSPEKLAQYELKVSTLAEIYEDHTQQTVALEHTATLLASTIQKIADVHSVRWRIKDASHLISKIIRKHESGNEKYKNIDATSYRSIIQDLIGLRALHLYKRGMFSIDDEIRKTLNILEGPTAYIRQGDLKSAMEEKGFIVHEHADAYRSVHYIIQTTPFKEATYSELQVRTIFEEGWAEIDHDIRYPNYSDNAVVKQFLSIFNRLCGGADEMGEFVKTLTDALSVENTNRSSEPKDTPSQISSLRTSLSKLQALPTSSEQCEIIETLTQQITDLESIYTHAIVVSTNAVQKSYKGLDGWALATRVISDVIAASVAAEKVKKEQRKALDMEKAVIVSTPPHKDGDQK
ncbi:RelA/SpoT domain-containing protein [Pseudomonas syringae]|uniref:RelA/SpoT domain-containing protein n=1 Tax=Pseudomonas syringae TaxID=317 RepID=UPI000CDA189B|nr:hypothetical protein [Pseudomonas syringae]POR65111.1 hypothetical protein BKM10_10255 [Pseudomonas syringae pv. syringae]